MKRIDLSNGCRAIRQACSKRFASCSGQSTTPEPALIEVQPPATIEEIVRIEDLLGIPIPTSMRRVLATITKGVEIDWQLPEGIDPPEPISSVSYSSFKWSLDTLVEMERKRGEWVHHCFSNLSDPYDAVWHRKLAIISVPNGDMHAIDLSRSDGPVVYLSHDDGEGHGYTMGKNFEDYLERMIALGAPGPEDWLLVPFVESATSGIDPDGSNGMLWRKWFGLIEESPKN